MGPAEWGTCIRTVFFGGDHTLALAYCNNTIATGFTSQDIIIFDALTGSQTAVLSGHSVYIVSLAFSSDGTLLVSGSNDGTVKLWDVQTGGVVKTFDGHMDPVLSVSISADNTMIASGSTDNTIHLWSIGTEECHVIRKHEDNINTVSFSPTDPQLLLSASEDDTVRQWGIDGHQIDPPYAGSYVAFSSDGTQFVSCAQKAVTVQNTDFGATVAKFYLIDSIPKHCCFSPDGRLITASVGNTIYVWDISSPDPHLVKTLMGHTDNITSLVFSSSLTLISASEDKSVKFWDISVLSVDPVACDTEPTVAPISTVSLQSKDMLAFSIDSTGVVKTWDILTGLCKESFKTEANEIHYGDMQLISGRLIVVWCKWYRNEIHVWDAEKGRFLIKDVNRPATRGIRITGDGTRVLRVNKESIQAWSIWTREPAGMQGLEGNAEKYLDPIQMDGSKVLVRSGVFTQGWDFGVPGSIPTQLSEASSDRPHLDFIVDEWPEIYPYRIEDRVTGNEVFRLYGRYANPSAIQWDGQYLIAGYKSGEVLVLDFSHMLFE